MLDVECANPVKGVSRFVQSFRDDPQFSPKHRRSCSIAAAWMRESVRRKSSQYFGYLPRMRFAIKPSRPILAPFYTSAAAPGVYP